MSMRVAHHKLALTSGGFVSVLFFLSPHGMCRRRQEKLPALIVRNQRTEQGVGPYQGRASLRPTIYGVGTFQITPIR